MKALVLTEFKKLEMLDVAEPKPGAGDVKVRVLATGICGSDVHGFLGHSARRQPGLILGHETMGVVTDGDDELAGKRVSINPLITCGICGACRSGRQNCCATWRLLGMDQTHGGFGEYVIVSRKNVHPLPDHVTDAAAVMVEPLANAFHILSMIPASAGLLPQAVIIGGGTLGSCILSVAKARGLNILAVSEPNPARVCVAHALGAETVLDPTKIDVVQAVREMTDGLGVPTAIDAVGISATRNAAAGMVQKGGTALLLGLDQGPTSFDFFDLIRREVRLQTSFAYSDSDYREALNFVIANESRFAQWTDSVPLQEGQSSFERLIDNPGDRIKIALIP